MIRTIPSNITRRDAPFADALRATAAGAVAFASLILLCLGLSAQALAAAPHLPGAPRDGWVSYRVPILAGRAAPCCHDHGSGTLRNSCDLDRDNGFTISDSDAPSQPGDELTVYVRFADGAVDRLRALGAACPVRSATPVQAVGIDAGTSLAFLRGLVEARAGSGRKHGSPADDALGAIAYHAEPSATRTLADLAAAGAPSSQRENAIFWLGVARGRDGAAIVEDIVRNDADVRIRRHAVFALSQSDAIDVHATLLDLARTDADDEVRSQALFWMAQHGDTRAAADIADVLRTDRSDHVRDQAVFALSQLESGGVEALIGLVRGDAPRAVKKKAMFWLGQSDSDAAVALLDDVLTDAER
ncbi:HEAT repeat domain-containing protein [Chiayiivirga flava]|uniref:HEAT repeat domain-containing protein n=1 Tax=Chiayiivirga flava TaxID=659595 RepID=A0A7W8FYP1_9GAMM|nr:HEAT repeat domain-containing protein [Chiayiivirga flava]MBB5207607.1 hypothetical protein [Chiayiivirga flava]